MHQKYLVKFDYNVDLEKIYCENRAITGPIVIVDDVVRTGRTLNKVKNFLRESYPDSPIYCVVLVVASNENDGDKIFDIVDYTPWFSDNKDITLPWSRDSKQIMEKKKYFDDNEMDQIVGRIKYLENLNN